jgi:hypothetical protein
MSGYAMINDAFDHDVEITTRPHRKAGEAGRIIFNPHAG